MSNRVVSGVVMATMVFCLAGTTVLAGPVFVKFMKDDNPGDQLILRYWEKAENDKLEALALLDLGTMLFKRGFINDAAEIYKRAAKKDKTLAEPWFRIGLIEQQRGDLRPARRAYMKCLDRASGHGWCNFYVGLIDEKRGSASSALKHFETAFRHAPELADPAVNPQVLFSELYIGALVAHSEEQRFASSMPLTFMEPGKIEKNRSRIEQAMGLDQPPEPAMDDVYEQPQPATQSELVAPPKPPVSSESTAAPKPPAKPAPLAPAKTPPGQQKAVTEEQKPRANQSQRPGQSSNVTKPRKRSRPAGWRQQRRPAQPAPTPTPVPPG